MKYLYYLLIILLPETLVGQASNFNDSYFKSENYLSFSLMAQMYQKPTIIPIYGEKYLSARPGFSRQFGFTYTYNINDKIAIKTGISRGRIPNRLYINRDFFGYLGNDLLVITYSLPILFELKLQNKKSTSNYVSLLAGFNILMTGHHQYSTSIWEDTTVVFKQTYYIDGATWENPKKTFLQYNLGASYYIPLKNHHLLSFSLLLNLSFTNKFWGEYYFLESERFPVASGGRNQMRMSYLGIETSYSLTRKKKVKRFNEEMKKLTE
jgi:hypothetical protein